MSFRLSRVALLFGTALMAAAGTTPAFAGVTAYLGNGDLASFDTAAGTPPVSIDFDATATGTDLDGTTVNGVKFASPSGNTLLVVKASDTVSFCCGAAYTMAATSGENILSPGGTDLAAGPDVKQRDGLVLIFAKPLSAFGVDMIFQSLDGFSLAGYTAYGPDGVTVVSFNTFLSVPSITGSGAYFIGLVSDDASTNISKIVFNDDDDNDANPDSNLAYDTFRFVPPRTGTGVPEPMTLAVFAAGLAGLGALRRK